MNYMDIIQLVNTGILLVGFPLILKAFLDIGKKLQILEAMEREMRVEIKPAIQELNRRMIEVEKKLAVLDQRVDIMWEWFSRYILTDNRTIATNK